MNRFVFVGSKLNRSCSFLIWGKIKGFWFVAILGFVKSRDLGLLIELGLGFLIKVHILFDLEL